MVDICIMRARIAERKVMQEGHIHYSLLKLSQVHHRLIVVYKIIIMEGL